MSAHRHSCVRLCILHIVKPPSSLVVVNYRNPLFDKFDQIFCAGRLCVVLVELSYMGQLPIPCSYMRMCQQLLNVEGFLLFAFA